MVMLRIIYTHLHVFWCYLRSLTEVDDVIIAIYHYMTHLDTTDHDPNDP